MTRRGIARGSIARDPAARRPVGAGAALALVALLAACEGGYTEATSPCVGADAPRLSFHARTGPAPGGGPDLATRRGGPGCDFTALGAP